MYIYRGYGYKDFCIIHKLILKKKYYWLELNIPQNGNQLILNKENNGILNKKINIYIFIYNKDYFYI